MSSGTIFDIKEFAVFDGPGIRTTVFMKGCPLRCRWCHNPEGLQPRPQLMVSRAACLNCGACQKACPSPESCILCGRCISACRGGLRRISGESWEAEALAARLQKDADVYRLSGGGVTFSGGEPLIHDQFIKELFSSCQAEIGGFLTQKQASGAITEFQVASAVRFITKEGADTVREILDYIAEVLGENRETLCESTGEPAAVSFYAMGEQVLALSESAAEQVLAQNKEKQAGSRGKAFALAAVCALGGVALWVIIGMVGFIAWIAGFAIAWLARWGYTKANGKPDKLAIAGIVTITILFSALGMLITYVLNVYMAAEGMLTLMESVPMLFELLANEAEFMAGFIKDLAFGIFVGVLGSVSVAAKMRDDNFRQLTRL